MLPVFDYPACMESRGAADYKIQVGGGEAHTRMGSDLHPAMRAQFRVGVVRGLDLVYAIDPHIS